MSQQQRTLLIVDDSPEDRELYRRYLRRDREYSYTIFEATLGRQGLELWQQHQPDVILLDYRLPDLDGLEFLAQLQPLSQGICLPVIVVTGQGNEAIAVQAMKAGAQDYLVKEQISPEGLQIAVNGAIETARLRTQLQQRIERDSVISYITQQIHQSLNLDEILQTTVAEVRRFLHTDRVLVFQLKPDGDGTVIAESVGAQWRSLLSSTIYDPCLAENYLAWNPLETVTYDPAFVENYIQRYRQGYVTAIFDIQDSSIDPCHVELLAQFQVKANLVVPIIYDNHFWGLLIAHNCETPRRWQPLEIDLLKELAIQVSIAIRQAELYQQAQNELTERRRVEAELRESEERFRQIAENIDVVFWLREASENRVSYVSPAYKHLWGLNPEELYQGQQSWIDRIHPEDRELTDRAFHEKAVVGQFDEEYRIILADGSIRWVHDRCFPLRDETGEIYRFAGIAEDISERKQAEQALRNSEERLQMALEGSGGGLWDWNIITNEDYLSPRWLEMLGYEKGELPDDFSGWERLIHPDDKVWVMERLNAHLQDDSVSYKFEYQMLTKSGEWKWIANHGKVVSRDQQGNPLRMAGIHHDVTDRKQAELALRQSEEFKNRILDSSSDCIKVLSLEGRLLYMNTGGMCLMEIDDLDSYLNTEWLCFWENSDRQQAEQALAAAQIGEISIFCGYCPTVKGTPKWWEVVVSPILDASGEMERILLISRDITDRKQVEKALRQSEERYRCLAELIPQLVWTANPEGALLDANQRWLEYTGLTPEQAQTRGWKEIVHPDDVLIMAQQWSEAVQHSTSYQAQGRMRRADGVYRWHLHQAIPQKDQQGQIVKWFGSATDIEAQKQLEAERDRLFQLEQAARAEAERANRIKDEFLAILSHELRSPLNPILGWTKLLQTRKFNETKTAEALAIIERNAKLQTQLIDDLLDVAKILRGKLSINAAPVNLAFVIESAIDTVSTTAVAKSILLHPVLPNIGQVSGDSNRLQQIVWNLLSNAIKFTPKGGRVEIRLERVGDQAQIIVSDTGKGINPDFLPYMFESFRQEDVSVTRKFGGLGLGLAIVRQLVEAHGGAITANSPGEGLGATFTVQLPLLNVQSEIKQTNELSQQALKLTGIRVLTVDDDADARELLTVLLTEYGATVLTVTSAAEVLANLESFQPDVLVSDIGMPEVDGYTLIQQIRALTAEKGGQIPAIALTAYARVDDYEQAITCGYQRHVTKPLNPEELVQAVVALAHNRLLA